MIKLSDYVIRFIEGLGVRHIFLLPGGGSMHLVDSVGQSRRLDFVCNLHEQACAIAADAYGQYTNHLGVALVTTGPGGTNALTGVAASWLDSTPVLVLSGQVKRADMTGDRGVRQMGFQEIHIVDMVRPITKYAATVTEPETIRHHLEKAVHLAVSGRPGPVWIDIPLDVQAAMVDPDRLAPYVPEPAAETADRLADPARRVAALLREAERPVILVGNGVRLSGAEDEFERLTRALGVPVLTTWKTIDFFDDAHPLFAGRPGIVAQRGANFAMQNADLFVSVGARLDIGQIGFNHRHFARAAKKVVVDIDANEIKKLGFDVHVPVCGDAKAFIEALLACWGTSPPAGTPRWLERCKAWQAKYPVVLPEYRRETDRVNNYVLVDVLSGELSENDLVIPGSSGAGCEVTMQALRVKKGQRIFYTPGLGAMGFGIAASLGGCIASGGKRTVCIDGDGGFYMNVQELEVVRRLNLPIKYFLLNNQGYASIRVTQNNYFDGRFVASHAGSGLTLPSARKVADAFGIGFSRIENHTDIDRKIRRVLEQDGPVICEVLMGFEHTTAPKVSSYQKADGGFVSRPLEDLMPFLDRDEFKANMLIPTLEDE